MSKEFKSEREEASPRPLIRDELRLLRKPSRNLNTSDNLSLVIYATNDEIPTKSDSKNFEMAKQSKK